MTNLIARIRAARLEYVEAAGGPSRALNRLFTICPTSAMKLSRRYEKAETNSQFEMVTIDLGQTLKQFVEGGRKPEHEVKERFIPFLPPR